MSKRARPSVSAFEDPGGVDPAYRIGESVGDFFRQVRVPPFSGFSRQPQQFEQAFGPIRQQHFRARPEEEKKYGPVIRAERRGMAYARRKKRATSVSRRKRRTTRTSTRRRTRSRYGRIAKRRVARGPARRKTKVYRSKKSRSVKILQNKFMKTTMTPVYIDSDGTATLANVGNNLQGKCTWYCFRPMRPGDIDNVIAGCNNSADSSALSPDASGYMEFHKTLMQYKNEGNHRADVTVYALWPRHDMPAALNNMSGINPQMLQDAFSDRDLGTLTGARLPAYDEYDADIFRSNMPSMYKIKQIRRQVLEPGAYAILKHAVRDKFYNKQKFCINAAGTSISTVWDDLKVCGMRFLFRIQGSMSHDESQVTSGRASFFAGSTNTLTANQLVANDPTRWDQPAGAGPQPVTENRASGVYGIFAGMGGYHVSLYYRRRTKCVKSLAGEISIPQFNTISQVPPPYTLADEYSVQPVAMQENAMQG